MSRAVPRSTPVSEPYWEGCRRGELRLQRCKDCSKLQFYPRLFCISCQGAELAWEAVSGRGTLASYTVVRRGVSKAYPAPYVVVLVDLEEGPRLMSQLVDCDPEAVVIGAPVQVQFVQWEEGVSLPVFNLLPEEGA